MWDVGGQSSLRSYWRNYFESTDGLVWVVDSGDRQRLQLCAHELRGLLREEVTGDGDAGGVVGTRGCRGDVADVGEARRSWGTWGTRGSWRTWGCGHGGRGGTTGTQGCDGDVGVAGWGG